MTPTARCDKRAAGIHPRLLQIPELSAVWSAHRVRFAVRRHSVCARGTENAAGHPGTRQTLCRSRGSIVSSRGACCNSVRCESIHHGAINSSRAVWQWGCQVAGEITTANSRTTCFACMNLYCCAAMLDPCNRVCECVRVRGMMSSTSAFKIPSVHFEHGNIHAEQGCRNFQRV